MQVENPQLVPWHDPALPEDVQALEELAGVELEQETKDYLSAPAGEGHAASGRFHVVQSRYIFGTILVPEVIRDEDRVIYHEVNVIVTENSFVTLRKPDPEEGRRFDPNILLECHPEKAGRSSGEMFYRLMEDVSEAYEGLLEGLQDEIDELEERIGQESDEGIHRRYSSLRRDLVNARRNISPLLRALKAIEDERLDIDDRIFPQEIELLVKDVRDGLERVVETIPLVADLLSGVRDYHQSYAAQRQNDVMQKLTVVAALLLVPTLIVGVYGQNFDDIPETHWARGYAWSWGLILGTTLLQLLLFYRLGWIGKRKSKDSDET
jgi:magnesium transporter